MKKYHDCGVMERKLVEFEDTVQWRTVENNPASYLTNKESILSQIQDKPEVFAKVDPELYKDEEFMLEAVLRNGEILNHLRNDNDGKAIKRNPRIILEAMKNLPDAVCLAADQLLLDKDFLLQAVEYNPDTLLIASIILFNRYSVVDFWYDSEFIQKAVEANWNVLFKADNLPYERKDKLEKIFGVEIDKNEWKRLILDRIPNKTRYFALREQLIVRNTITDIGIDISSCPARIRTYADAEQLIDYRHRFFQGTLDPAKPVTVILYPRSDYNGVFEGNAISEILERSNQVLLFEVGTDDQRNKVLEELANRLPANIKISLIIGGHGAINRLEHADSDDNMYVLGLDDFNDSEFTNPLHKLNLRQVIFESCSTGAETKEEDIINLADLLAEHVRTGCQIYAPKHNVPTPEYEFNDDNSINKPIYAGTDTDTMRYQTNGKLPVPEEKPKSWWQRLLQFFRELPPLPLLSNRPAYGV